MSKIIAVCILACLLTIVSVADAKCKTYLKNRFEKCLAKGFQSSIENCNGADAVLKKRQLKTCSRIETKVKKCGYTCSPPKVDGGWSDFGNWSECSAECGEGVQTRSRSCNNPVPAHGGAECEGQETESRSCNNGACPVDGGWSDFGNWSECSAECGEGVQTRSRSCNNPAPAHGGAECEGEKTESRSCNNGACPVDGGWSDFGEWSECSAECGEGVQTRSRSCNNPAPAHGGAECEGQETESRSCNNGACPVDGGWSDFGEWSECSAECGEGVQTRSRSCNNPAPVHGGAECEGEKAESRSCNQGQCPGTCEGHVCLRGEANYIALPLGSRLNSPNGDYSMVMQADRNLVLYCKGNAVWASKTTGTAVSDGLTYQADGNLVLYDPEGNALWDTETGGTRASTMVMQNDGIFVLYTDDGKAAWSTGTNGQC